LIRTMICMHKRNDIVSPPPTVVELIQ